MTAAPERLANLTSQATDFAHAPCIGHWRWFDPPNDHEPAASVQSRHEAAVHLCGTCPLDTFARCAALTRSIPKPHRSGVWAGQVLDPVRTEKRGAA